MAFVGQRGERAVDDREDFPFFDGVSAAEDGFEPFDDEGDFRRITQFILDMKRGMHIRSQYRAYGVVELGCLNGCAPHHARQFHLIKNPEEFKMVLFVGWAPFAGFEIAGENAAVVQHITAVG